MFKKLTLLAMSVGASLAFAAPAAGSLVTNSLGEAAKTFVATSTNTRTTTAAGTLECTTTKMSGPFTTVNSTTVHGHGTLETKGTVPAASHSGHCGSSSGAVVEGTSGTINTFHLTDWASETTGTATLSFTYDLRSATGAGLIAECTFGGTVPVKKTGTSTINLNGKITKTAGSAFCPTEGTLNGDFSVTADGLGAAIIH